MKLSICCITYNHQDYIQDAINSFISQKHNYEFEIIVSDDHSTDKTAIILKQLKEKYPDKIKLILRKKNVGIYQNFLGVLEEARGEFIAYCDGDDYWDDNLKIEKQIQLLEKNPSCSFSCHDVTHVSEQGDKLSLMSKDRANESWEDGIYSYEKFIISALQIPHANSIVMRRSALNMDMLRNIGSFTMADYMLTCSLAFNGDCYYFKKSMSCYRDVKNSLKHHTTRNKLNKTKKELITNHKLINKYYNNKYSNEIQMHLYGKLMLMEIEVYLKSIHEKKHRQAIIALYYILTYQKRANHTLRDTLYLIKLYIKSINFNTQSSLT